MAVITAATALVGGVLSGLTTMVIQLMRQKRSDSSSGSSAGLSIYRTQAANVCLVPGPGYDDLEAPVFVPSDKNYYKVIPSGDVYYCNTGDVRGTRSLEMESADLFAGDYIDTETMKLVKGDKDAQKCANEVYSDSSRVPIVRTETPEEYLLCPGPGQKPMRITVDALGFVVSSDGFKFSEKTSCYKKINGEKIKLTSADFTAFKNEAAENGTDEGLRAGGNSYAVCEDDMIAQIGSCESYETFDPATQKCVQIEICEDLIDGAIVTPPSDVELRPDQWAQCEGGKTVIMTCATGQIFDWEERKCVTTGPCYKQPDGTQLPDPNNNQNYTVCSGGKPITKRCPNGTLYDDSLKQCVDQLCADKNTVEEVGYDFPPGKFVRSNVIVTCNEEGKRIFEYASTAKEAEYKLNFEVWLTDSLLKDNVSPSVIASLTVELPFYTIKLADGTERAVDITKDYVSSYPASYPGIMVQYKMGYYENIPFTATAGLHLYTINHINLNTKSTVLNPETGKFGSASAFFPNGSKWLNWEDGFQTSYITTGSDNSVTCPGATNVFDPRSQECVDPVANTGFQKAVSYEPTGVGTGYAEPIELDRILSVEYGFICGTKNVFYATKNTREHTVTTNAEAKGWNKEYVPIFKDRNKTYKGPVFFSKEDNTQGLQAIGLKTAGTRRRMTTNTIRLYKANGLIGTEYCKIGYDVLSDQFPFCVKNSSRCEKRIGGPGSLILRSVDEKNTQGFTYLEDGLKNEIKCVGTGWTTGVEADQISETVVPLCTDTPNSPVFNPLTGKCVAKTNDVCAQFKNTKGLIYIAIPDERYMQNVVCQDGKYNSLERTDTPRINAYFDKSSETDPYTYENGELKRILVWTKRNIIVTGYAVFYPHRHDWKVVNNVDGEDDPPKQKLLQTSIKKRPGKHVGEPPKKKYKR